MHKAIVIGVGGHSRAVIDVLLSCGKHKVVGLLDLNEAKSNEFVLGVPVIGSIHSIENFFNISNLDFFIAIGDNLTRKFFFEKLSTKGLRLPALISNKAVVSSHAKLGDGVFVSPLSFIGPEVVIGNNTIVNTGAIVEHEVIVGEHSHLGPVSTVLGRTKIGDQVFIGSHAVIRDGLNICSSTIIGAGAVVVKSITDPSGFYIGVPASN